MLRGGLLISRATAVVTLTNFKPTIVAEVEATHAPAKQSKVSNPANLLPSFIREKLTSCANTRS
jgi:hypothetical protein